MIKSEMPDDEAQTSWARLVRVSQSVLASVEVDLRREGFPPLAQYDALLELRRAGDKGLRPFELRQEMLLAQYSVSRLVDRLVKAGFVDRHDSEDDGRGQVLKITSSGRDLLEAMWPIYGKAIQNHFAVKLSPTDIRNLAHLMAQLDTRQPVK
ncbi:MarR family winged helix-turn-helix transcriptional regulator [Litorivita pollutaquae]|nr:MarR family winged helix-turn-helix transcriptional regulator [Litorivita pollutaquae]